MIKPRRMEHLQSEEPFSSDPYFNTILNFDHEWYCLSSTQQSEPVRFFRKIRPMVPIKAKIWRVKKTDENTITHDFTFESESVLEGMILFWEGHKNMTKSENIWTLQLWYKVELKKKIVYIFIKQVSTSPQIKFSVLTHILCKDRWNWGSRGVSPNVNSVAEF